MDRVSQLLKSKRFVRSYTKKQISKKTIMRLLDIARYAPSGQNRQPVRWLVIDDYDEVHRLAGLVTKWMKGDKQAQPDLYKSAKMEIILDPGDLDPQDLGKDRIARGFPA
jgi:nitroreductase